MQDLRRLLRDSRGAVAVEFALVGFMLIMTILFILVVALIAYINQALDYATAKSARQIMTGVVQTSAMTQATFTTNVVCNYLPSTIPCASIVVNLYTVTKGSNPSQYYQFVNSNTTALAIPPLSNASATFQLGGQAAYQYLQVIYPITFLPSAFASVLGGGANYNGSPAYLAVSTAAFRNEQY